MTSSNYHDGEKKDECYFCGCGPPLREHHIIPQRFGGPDTKDNIVELCDLCHKKLERLYDKSFYEWFGIQDETGERKFHRQCGHSECTNQAKVQIRDLQYHSDYRDMTKTLYDWAGAFPDYLCRPHIAELASKLEVAMERKYLKQREELHAEARRAHKTRGPVRYPLGRLTPRNDAEDIMEDLVRDAADY